MKILKILKSTSVWFGIVLVLCAVQPSFASSLHSPKYQVYFKTYWAKYMPGHRPEIFVAQCYQESRFKARAVSPVGAKGVCQFMPATWRDMQARLGIKKSPFDPKSNIKAAAYYNSLLYRRWTTKRPYQDQINLMLACFNAGCGNIDSAQKLCNMAVLYNDIIACLPQVTKHHATETINYVKHINRFAREIRF